MKTTCIYLGLGCFALVALLFFYTPSLPEAHGHLETKLYLGESENQPLIVGFGGGEGGNAWTSARWSKARQKFIDEGYAFLAIGYFGGRHTPSTLDRISLDAIHDSIQSIAQHPLIDAQKIALIGGSKGAELILNLASIYSDYSAVAAIVPAHVSMPALTYWANTSSWMHQGQPLPYAQAPMSTIIPAIQGDLLGAFNIILADSSNVKKALIPLEKINGSILLLSAENDEQWPSTYMSNQIGKRLKANQFAFHFEHIAIQGSHAAPLNHLDSVFNFLNSHFRYSKTTHTSMSSLD